METIQSATSVTNQPSCIKRQRENHPNESDLPVKKQLCPEPVKSFDQPDLSQRSVSTEKVETLASVSTDTAVPIKLCSEQAVINLKACCEKLNIPLTRPSSGNDNYKTIAAQLEQTMQKMFQDYPPDEAANLRNEFEKILYQTDKANVYKQIINSKTSEEIETVFTPTKQPVFNLHENIPFECSFLFGSLFLNEDEQKLMFASLALLSKHPHMEPLIAQYQQELETTDISEDDGEISKMIQLKIIDTYAIFLADLTFVIRNSSDAGSIINNFFLDSNHYIETLKERYSFYKKMTFMPGMSNFFILLNCNILWWQKATVCSTENQPVSSALTTTELTDFLCKTCIPQWLETIIFGSSNECHSLLLPSSLIKTVLPQTPCQLFNAKQMLFGEEFEYTIPQTKDIDILDLREHELNAVQTWKNYVQAVKPTAAFDDEQPDFDRITTKFGEWQVTLYPESALQDECIVMEFNASPYSADQQFKTDETTCSAYKLLADWVIKPAKSFGWKECSGHKHIDIIRAVGNNTELLFRLLIDIENQGWFPAILQRAAYSKEYYPYLCQLEQPHTTQILENTISHFNRCLTQGKNCKGGETFFQLIAFKGWWGTLRDSTKRYHPCQVNYNFPTTPESVLNGEISEANTTLEFRFFHCARNETEIKLINELLIAWLENLSSQQQEKQPVYYQPVNPVKISFEEAVDCFRQFVTRLGLDPKTYEQLIWYPPENTAEPSITDVKMIAA
ncbi:MAG: hypothetical protein OXC48_01585 [Endozoicomonadaceae bacterium]|nr:hypothetical protein [Endozoicomonadaceae bacterium]